MKSTIEANSTQWLWQGGVFSLPLAAKELLLKEAQYKLDLYVKAKLSVIIVFTFFLKYF